MTSSSDMTSFDGVSPQIDFRGFPRGGKNPLSEESFRELILSHLTNENGYDERVAKKRYDPARAMDTDMLFSFLEASQPETMEKLHGLYNGGMRETVLNKITGAIGRHGLVYCLRHGVDFERGITLRLSYPKPKAPYDAKAWGLYDKNKLTVMTEVHHKANESVDLVIFLNGLAIITIELKCQTSATGWDYREAIRQYREDRDCSTRLLAPRTGALVHFAMDMNQVWMCAELKGKDSKFLPFNQGVRKEGSLHETMAGNPWRADGYATAYMWEFVLKKDTVISLVYDFVYNATPKDAKKRAKKPIFPRYQQLRAVHRVAEDIAKAGLLRNYLIEHSAGSGKTNTICWLAHTLSGLYAEGEDRLLFSKVLIVTDRIVVDNQLQRCVRDMADEPNIVSVIDSKGQLDDYGETSKSGKLKRALEGNARIVVCTMATFLQVEPGTFDGTGERFAVIIDEAHSSTSGETMGAINAALSDFDEPPVLDRVAAVVAEDIARAGCQKNVSLIGFTATPTASTLQLFGSLNTNGHMEAFDLYSMRQAIDEGFILDVTSNYTTYGAFCKVVKSIPDDPELESAAAKRELAHLISVADGTINGKLNIIVKHFTEKVTGHLGGHAKAMIVTPSREAAVRYRLAYDALREKNLSKLGGHRALVAFSGKVEVDGEVYTEVGMNGGLDEGMLPEVFDGDDYDILIVADKYQTGFDQPKLAAMYVDKTLRGLAAVQTLSRLNRICPPYDKQPFVLDFVNGYEDITKAFAPYYENTVLENPLTLDDLRNTERVLLDLDVLVATDVQEFCELLLQEKQSDADLGHMIALLDRVARKVRAMDEEDAEHARRVIRLFLRQYAFLIMSAPFSDEHMHMEYLFCRYLLRQISAEGHAGEGVDLSDKISLEDFRVENKVEHKGKELESAPEVFMTRNVFGGLSQSIMEQLSKIIADWNARFSKTFDVKVAAATLVAMKGKLESDERVQVAAKSNGKHNFASVVEGRAEDALVDSYDQNEEFYTFLLNQPEVMAELVHLLVDDLYSSLSRPK